MLIFCLVAWCFLACQGFFSIVEHVLQSDDCFIFSGLFQTNVKLHTACVCQLGKHIARRGRLAYTSDQFNYTSYLSSVMDHRTLSLLSLHIVMLYIVKSYAICHEWLVLVWKLFWCYSLAKLFIDVIHWQLSFFSMLTACYRRTSSLIIWALPFCMSYGFWAQLTNLWF